MERLTEIANRCKTDKGTTYRVGHGYTPLYEVLFQPLRDRPINLMEIGLCIGGPELETGAADRTINDAPSVRMWRSYFPQASIYGVDISDFSQFETDWFRFFRADCGDASQLDKVARCGVEFDLIVDDGSHASFHQQLTFLKLFPLLKAGGLFIIEDMDWQPANYERSLPKVPRTDQLLGDFIRNGKFAETGAITPAQWAEVESSIANVLLFDEDYLYDARQLYNRRSGATPDIPNYQDTEVPARFFKRGYARRVLEDLRRLGKTVTGDIGPSRQQCRTKLAVIQKK